MSKNSNIQRLPVEIDPFRLVDQGRIFDGRIPINDFPRLKEQLFEGDDDIDKILLMFTLSLPEQIHVYRL